MGRRRRRRREPEYIWWVAFGGLGVVAWFVGSWRLGLILILAWCLYEFALVPTVCRVMTRQGFACHEPVRGRLYACSSAHQQVKSDALWRLARVRNPLRRPAADPNRETGVVVYSPAVRGRLAQSDQTLLVVAGIGTVLTVVGMVVGLIRR